MQHLVYLMQLQPSVSCACLSFRVDVMFERWLAAVLLPYIAQDSWHLRQMYLADYAVALNASSFCI